MNKKFIVVEQSALAEGGHYFSYTRAIAQAACKIGFDTLILQNKRFTGDWKIEGVRAKAAFTHAWSEADHLWIEAWGPGNLAYELVEATRADPPRRGDHVFVHTMSYAELRNMLVYLAALPQGFDLPVFHLLLRYDPDVLQGSIAIFKPLFDTIAISPRLRAHVRFHTDTDLLSEAFTRLSGVPFTTLPIPFLQDRLLQRLGEPGTRPAERPLTIIYLGDARLEKNYSSLPAALARLWPDYGTTGRVRFVLQSNFNVPRGEAGVLEAAQRLGQYPTRFVELIADAMRYEDYYDRLFEADAVVIPYDAQRYRMRSSGILIEAMAAGKPVVTTAGSWMAGIVDASHAVICRHPDELGEALETLLRDFKSFRKGAEARARPLLEWSSGENFVRALVAEAARGAMSPPDGPRIFIVIDGDAITLRNGAGRVAMNQLDYLTKAGFRIGALFVMRSFSGDAAEARHALEVLKREIAPYWLEAAFVAAPGRLSLDRLAHVVQSSDHDNTISADVVAMSDLDVAMDLAEYVAKNVIDVVFCNYVQTLPILQKLGLADKPSICEIIDVQSFQKAIYGRRPIRRDDLDLEFELLKSFDRLISLNPVETAYVEERLPDARVTTTGIVVDADPPTFRSLAGFADVTELIAGCGLQAYGSQLPSTARLTGLMSIDLVYVSSNHLANVSGLRWFLDDVYVPHLADLGITMVVAGSIAEVGPWPDHENLVFVGRVRDVAPLYAAAKVVVIPITEGAGMPVKTAEALSYGRPIVATRTAMRGTDIDSDAVALADEPVKFADAVRALLASPEKRHRAGERARRLAMRTNDPARYTRLMNEVFADLLGTKARAVEPIVRRYVRSPLLVEWNGLVLAVNRLCRAWLANEPVDQATIDELARHRHADVLVIVAEVGHALLDERSAPALSAFPNLARSVAELPIGTTSAALVAFADLVVGFLSDAALPATALAEFGAIPRYPLDVTVVGPVGFCETLLLGDVPLKPVRQIDHLHFYHVQRAPTSAPRCDVEPVRIEIGAGDVPHGERSFAIVATQTVPLRTDVSVLSRPIVEGERAAVQLRAGDTTSLSVPPLPARPQGRRYVDVVGVCRDEATLVILLHERPIETRTDRHDGRLTLRFEVPVSRAHRTTKIGIMALNAPVTLLEMKLHCVQEHDFENALDLVHGLETGDRETAAELALREPGALLRSLLTGGHLMRPASGDVARFLRGHLARGCEPQSLEALARAVTRALEAHDGEEMHQRDREAEGRTLATMLWPATAIAEKANNEPCAQFVSARSLSFTIVVPGPADGWTCALDGQILPRAESEALSFASAWSYRGVPDNGLPRLRTLIWRDAAGTVVAPSSPRLVISFPAGQDIATKTDHVVFGNVYEREMFSDVAGLVWTGPGAQSSFTMPCALSNATEIVVTVCNFGAVTRAEDVSILVNGTPLVVDLRKSGLDGVISGHYKPGEAIEPAVTTVDILVWRSHQPPGDSRKLGIAVSGLQFHIGL